MECHLARCGGKYIKNMVLMSCGVQAQHTPRQIQHTPGPFSYINKRQVGSRKVLQILWALQSKRDGTSETWSRWEVWC